MTTCTDNAKYTEVDVKQWTSALAKLLDIEPTELTCLHDAALEGVKVPGLVRHLNAAGVRDDIPLEGRVWTALNDLRQAREKVSALQAQVDMMVGAIATGLDYTPTPSMAGDRVRGIIADGDAAMQREADLQARVAELERERDEAKQEAFNQANIAKTWELRCARAESERDALRAQVEAARQWAEKNMERVVVYPERLLKKMDEAAALSAPPAETKTPRFETRNGITARAFEDSDGRLYGTTFRPAPRDRTCNEVDCLEPATFEGNGARRYLCTRHCPNPPAETTQTDTRRAHVIANLRREALERLARFPPVVADDGAGTVSLVWHDAEQRTRSYAVTTEQMRWMLGDCDTHTETTPAPSGPTLCGDPDCEGHLHETTPAPNSPAGPDGSPPTEPESGAYTLARHAMLSQLDVRPAVPPLLERLPEADPYVAKVTEFHVAMDLPVRKAPDVGTVEERALAGKLILEEAFELLDAMGLRVRARLDAGDYVVEVDPDGPGPNLVQMLHELADLQYVVSGRAVQFGLPLLAAVLEEIHPANLRKLGPDGRPVTRADGKVIKPDGWEPAKVARVLRRAQEGRPSLPQRIDSSLAKLGHELTPTGSLVASEVDAMLHPSGRCSCAGEGQCEWCRARCDACGGPGVPESVRLAVVRVWSALRVTTPEQGVAVAVLRAVFPELPVPDGDEGREAVKLLMNRQAARVQGALGMCKPPDALSYQDVVLMAQACKAALADVLDRHDLPEPAKDRVTIVHNSLVDVWQGVAFLQHLAGSAMVKAVRDAARLGAEDMRERAARRLEASATEESAPKERGTPETYTLSHQMALRLELEALAVRDLPLLPGEEAPHG